MRKLVFALAMALATTAATLAQPAATTLRASGEHRITDSESADAAHALALADAQRNLWKTVVARLQAQADVKTLALKQAELEAYTAALIETTEVTPGAAAAGPVAQVTVTAPFDEAKLAQRMTALRKDHEAALQLQSAWTDLQRVKDGRGFAARLLTARATAASARTESGIAGSRVRSAAGKQQAMTLIDQALVLVPDAPYAHFTRGDLLIDLEKPVDAEASFRTGLRAQPDSSDGHRRLAEALRQQGKGDEAEAELREAIRLEPTSALAHSDLAFLLDAQRKMPQAEAEYREAVRLDPDLVDAHNGLAIAFARQGKGTEAVEQFKEMIRIDPDSASAYYNMASVLADLDRDAEASAALRETIRINPNHYNAHYNLGEMFRLEGKYEDAAKQFREYLRLAPPDANPRNVDRAKRLVQQFEDPAATPAR
jgi:tetratricopeptide (TPR) repeat protein